MVPTKAAVATLFDQPPPVRTAKPEAPPLTVTGLTKAIRNTIETAFTEVVVEGEISNFTNHRNGHRYFTLKDEGAQIACVFWKSRSSTIAIANGQKALCRGRLTVYPPQGKYQFDVQQIRPLGVGALQLAYERLYKKLDAEGLFDQSRKRRIPAFPRTIGVVTSSDGAALHDIATVVRRRYPLCRILLRATAVQGIGAELQIAQAIGDLNRLPQGSRPDVLIAGRGGGSLEDLWCFNEEAVARAIFASTIPVISAVGHEVDVTIADFVADLRAPTPTAAAELATPDRAELLALISGARNTTTGVMRRFFGDVRYDLEHRIGTEAIGETMLAKIGAYREAISRSNQQMASQLRHWFELHRLKIGKNRSSLAALNPTNILDRGYALVRRSDGSIVTSSREFPPEAEVLFKDGGVAVRKG